MSQLYLIAHKVRGEPAFDVAQKMLVGEETYWIIPTSGHRAYPYWQQQIGYDGFSIWINEGITVGVQFRLTPMPSSLRDHYSLNEPKRAEKPAEILIDIDDLMPISEQEAEGPPVTNEGEST